MLRSCADPLIDRDAPAPSTPILGLTRDLCGEQGQGNSDCRFLGHFAKEDFANISSSDRRI